MQLRILLFIGMLFSSLACHAGFVIDVQEVGADVVVTGSGTINTNSLALVPFVGDLAPSLFPNEAVVSFLTATNPSGYLGVFAGPTDVGGGIGDFASTSAGDPFAFFPLVIPGQGAVLLGDGYVSGSSIATTMTFAGSSLASIGITPGTYTWTFGAGADSDFITIQVASVPEPAGIAMASLGLVLAARGFRRSYCLQNHGCPRD